MVDFWEKEFEVPIQLVSGASLVTLRDASVYIDKLSKAERAKPAWQLAATELQKAATNELAWRFIARIAILNALYGDAPPSGNGSPVKGRKKWRELRKLSVPHGRPRRLNSGPSGVRSVSSLTGSL